MIQQNPDLCASIGFWGIMESGAAQAIRNAGKIDQVKVYASGEGSQLDCDQVNQGNFYKFLSYKATEQGHDLMSAAVTLLEDRREAGHAGTTSTTRSRSGSTRPTPAAAIASPCRRRQQPRRCRWRQRPTEVARLIATPAARTGRRELPAGGSAMSMSINTMGTSFGTRLRASLSPRLLLSELLLKQWFEPVIPFTLMIALLLWFSATIPNYAGLENFLSLMRLYAEFGFVALGMAFCLITGGIDLSVGAIFALCNFTALFFLLRAGLPVPLVILGTLAVGAAVGSINGLLIGYLKARPFLTTLVTLIILRASVNILNEKFATVFATNSVDSDTWDFLGEGYRARHSDQCRDAYCRADHRAHLSEPLALRLAPDRDRRQPQGGAPCRHSGRADAALHLCAVGRCSAPSAASSMPRARPARIRRPGRLGIPGADRRRAGRRLACRRQGHRLARHDRRRSSSSC